MRLRASFAVLIMGLSAITFTQAINMSNIWKMISKNTIFGDDTKHLSPVIFVPGDGGSQMEAMLDKPENVHLFCQKKTTYWFSIWLNMELLVPLVIDCWIDNMRLIYNNETRTTINAPGVSTRIPGWGTPEVVEWLDPTHASAGAYFKDIGNALVANNYVRNISLRGAPYDFRKAPNENKEWFINMKSLVEETYEINSNTPVTLVVHSMGAPMSLLFLQQQPQAWKDKYIKRMISLAGAWAGSAKAVKVFAIGDDLGAYALRGSVMRDEQITSPSLSWLMPSPLFWKPNEILVKTQGRSYTMSQMEDFFSDLGYSAGWEMRVDSLKYSQDFTAPGVEIHCIFGSHVDTVESLNYKKSYDFSAPPELQTGNGDGTVNTRSLEACKHWTEQQKQKITLKELPGVDHMNILANGEVIDYIVKLMMADLSGN